MGLSAKESRVVDTIGGSRSVNLNNLSANVNSTNGARGASGTERRVFTTPTPSVDSFIFRPLRAGTPNGGSRRLVALCGANAAGAARNFMKRHGNLFERIADPANVRLAIRKAVRNKRLRKGMLRALARGEGLVSDLSSMLLEGRYRTSAYHWKTIREPKTRTIYSLPFYPDRIVHHAIMNVLEPIWDRLLDDACHSCRKGRGCHSASRRCMEYARRYRYVLQCDVSKFYPSMNHAVMKAIVRRKIKDKRLLDLVDEIIDSANSIPGAVVGRNAPIGNLTSQWLGNLYLNEFDLWLRRTGSVEGYLRYSDDFLIFSDDREKLRSLQRTIPEFLAERLKLRLGRSRLFRTSQGIDFVGYRHFPKYVLVRKRTARKIKRTARKACGGLYRKFSRAQGKIASYHGLMKHANTYHLRRSLNYDSLMEAYEVGQR